MGPLVALLPPLGVGATSLLVLGLAGRSLVSAIGLIGVLIAAPGLLIVGAPLGNDGHYVLAAISSALGWMALGAFSARRATRHPIADWHDYWREYRWLAGGVAAGVVIAVIIAGGVIFDGRG